MELSEADKTLNPGIHITAETDGGSVLFLYRYDFLQYS